MAKVAQNLERFPDGFPSDVSEAHKYRKTENVEWTTGFWPGQLWLAYECTGDNLFRQAALRLVDSFEERLRRRIDTDHHDLGFLYTLSCVAAYRIAKDERARQVALQAADCLLERYSEKAGFIQAWGPLEEPGSFRFIVDGAMNLPLLFWATEQTGKRHYARAAERSLATMLEHAIREDGSSYHTYYFDPGTGRPLRGSTHQGFTDQSCWARGQAWLVYGLPLCARYSLKEGLWDRHAQVTEYFLGHLPEDAVCYWDLVFQSGPQERDSSAAAIAACGLLEAAQHDPEPARRGLYRAQALRMVGRLEQTCGSSETEDGLLLHAVYSKPHGRGVDECCAWGDYFYLEALTRLAGDWRPYW